MMNTLATNILFRWPCQTAADLADHHRREAHHDHPAVRSHVELAGGHHVADLHRRAALGDHIRWADAHRHVHHPGGRQPPMRTVGQHGGRIGPPTCGTIPVTIGQVCMSPRRAAGAWFIRLQRVVRPRPLSLIAVAGRTARSHFRFLLSAGPAVGTAGSGGRGTDGVGCGSEERAGGEGPLPDDQPKGGGQRGGHAGAHGRRADVRPAARPGLPAANEE